MRPLSVAAVLLVAPLAGDSLVAQPPAKAPVPAVADSTVKAIESFARLQRAVNGLRDREQAELADPRNKKVESQREIREKYRKWRADSLAAHGYTTAQVNAMTLRLSSDDALRQLFETTMERLGK